MKQKSWVEKVLFYPRSLQKRGWREIAVLFLKGLLTLFIVHMNPVVLLGGMYLKLFLNFNFYFSYFLGLSAYGAWMMLQAFIFKRLHVDIKYFIKIKWTGAFAFLVSLAPFVSYAGLLAYHGYRTGGHPGDGLFELFLMLFVAIPLFVILSFLCFIYQTYCIVRSRKHRHPFHGA